MAKLPDNFVKPPPASSRLAAAKPSPGKTARRPRKLDGLEPLEAAAAPHVAGVLVRLSPEEHQAVAAACDALSAAGHTVSMEDMIRQVIARWMAATWTMQAPALPAHAAAPPPAALRPGLISIRAQLRRLTAQPLRRWRELGHTLRRWSRIAA